jgi:hypothetical protein
LRCTKASDAGGQPYAAYVLVCAFLLAGAALCGCSTAPIDTDGVEAAASDDSLPSADAVGDGYLGDGYLGDDAGRARADAGAADSAGSDAGVATDVGDDDGSDGDGSAGDGADDIDNPSDVGDGAAKPAIATIFVIPEAPVTANVTVVDKGNWAIALPLFGAEILAYRVEKGAAVIAQLGPLAGQVTPQSGTLSAPNAAVVVAGARLLRHGDGIAALVGATWLPSPLATALPGAVVAWRKGAGSAEVWLVAGGALHVWRSGVLATVPGLKLVGVPALAYGCHTPAGPGVWVAHQSGVVAVHVDTAGDAQVFAIAKADVVDGLVCDVNGRFWVAARDRRHVHGLGARRRRRSPARRRRRWRILAASRRRALARRWRGLSARAWDAYGVDMDGRRQRWPRVGDGRGCGPDPDGTSTAQAESGVAL